MENKLDAVKEKNETANEQLKEFVGKTKEMLESRVTQITHF